MWKMAAILKFKMKDQDGLEKNGTNSDIVAEGIKMPKIIGSTNVAKIAPTSQYSPYSDNNSVNLEPYGVIFR